MDELWHLLDEARIADGGAARRRERGLTRAATEGATMRGTLVDLVERRSGIVVRTDTGVALRGRLRLVGTDFCVVAAEPGDVWLALAGITSVRPDAGETHGAATGDRAAVDLSLAEALARIADERPRVNFVVAGGERLAGALVGVGADVASLRLDGDPPAVAYVSLASVRLVFRSG